MTDRPDLVIDGDGHVIEVDATYERIDPQYRERRPRYTQAGRGYIVRLVDGKVWGPETDIGFVGVNGNLPPPKRLVIPVTESSGVVGGLSCGSGSYVNRNRVGRSVS